MSHTGTDYQAMMRARGYRVTRQRKLILDAVCEGGGHTTLEEIYARVQAKAPHVNLATLYRNLNFLCKLHLVVAADTGSGHQIYEIAQPTPHHHLVCRACGAQITLENAELQPLYDSVAHRYDFHIDVDHLALFGYCAACAPSDAGLGNHEEG